MSYHLPLATGPLIERLTSKVPSVTAIAAVWSSSPTLFGDPACERERPLGFADSRPYSNMFASFESQTSLHVLRSECRRMIQAIQRQSKTAKQLANTIRLWHCNYNWNNWTKRRSASPSWILWTAWVCWPATSRWPVAISTCFFTWLQRSSLEWFGKQFIIILTTKIYQVHPSTNFPNQRNQEAYTCTCPTTSHLQQDRWLSVWPLKCLLSLPSQQSDRHLPLSSATPPDRHCPKCLKLLGEHESETESIPTQWAWILCISPLGHEWNEMSWWRFAWVWRNAQSSQSASQIIRIIFNDVWSKPRPGHPTAELF